MKRRVTSIVIALMMLFTTFDSGLVLSTYGSGSTVLPISVTYNDFASNTLSNNASGNTLFYYTSSGYAPNVSSGKLRITNNSNSKSATVVRRSPIKINQGFSTYFQADIYNQFQGTGDGLCFIMYDSSNGYQYGPAGGGLGYSGITGDSLAVELDSYFNSADEFKSGNLSSDAGDLEHIAGSNYLAHHVAINTNDDAGSTANVRHDSSSATSPSTDYNTPTDDGADSIAHYYQDLYDSTAGGGNPTNVWVDLVPISGDAAHAEVLVTYGPDTSRASANNYSFKRRISSDLLDDSVYVGFSASTGYSCEFHEIISWQFGNEPITGGIDPSAGYTQAASGITVDTQNGSGSTVTDPTHAVIQIKQADGTNMNATQNVNVSIDGGAASTIMTDANGALDFDLSGLAAASHTVSATTADGSAQSSKTFTITGIVQLVTPDNVTVSTDGVVSWGNADANASSFVVKVYKDAVVAVVNTVTNASSGTTTLLPSDYISSGTGNYNVTVTAVGDHASYNDSAESSKIQNMSVHSISLTIMAGNGTDSVEVGSNGAVTSASSVPYYYFGGKNVTITAVPASGRQVAWQDSSTANTYAITGLAANASVTATFSDASAPAVYTITYDGNGNTGGTVPLDGNNYANGDPATVLGNTGDLVKASHTFGGWNTQADGDGTAYASGSTYTMGATNVTLYAKWTASSSGHGGGSSHTPVPAPTAPKPAPVAEVNGEKTVSGVITVSADNGTITEHITVDPTSLDNQLAGKESGAVVTIPFAQTAETAVSQLNGQIVKNMEAKDAVLEIKTGNVSYTLPAEQIDIDSVSERIGAQVALKDIMISIAIAASEADTVMTVENTAVRENCKVVVKPVEFEITCTHGDKTVAVSQFNGYVERTVAIPTDADTSKITTGIVLNSNGAFSHVPTRIVIIDGKYYAKINSLTNSTYSVIWNPISLTDLDGHWAKDTVNDMGSRMVVSGIGNNLFEPDRNITRAEFAAIVVKGLGLMHTGAGQDAYSDVNRGDWFYDAVSISKDYGIVTGYGDGMFHPSESITREQAMAMIARAMKLTQLKVSTASDSIQDQLTSYADSGTASEWAQGSIAACLETQVVTGRPDATIAPKESITRAEVATIVRRLLQKSGLI